MEIGFRVQGLIYTENMIKISSKYVFEQIHRFKKIHKNGESQISIYYMIYDIGIWFVLKIYIIP